MFDEPFIDDKETLLNLINKNLIFKINNLFFYKKEVWLSMDSLTTS